MLNHNLTPFLVTAAETPIIHVVKSYQINSEEEYVCVLQSFSSIENTNVCLDQFNFTSTYFSSALNWIVYVFAFEGEHHL